VRIDVAAVLAGAADAVLVAHHLTKLGTHLATALAHLNERNLMLIKCMNRPAPAAQSLYVGLQWPCRGRACAGMLGEMARTNPISN
jgi:hypothetical protein